jgi:DNA-directed RNA polymerase subunit N (RpoN/RPB10)
MLIPVRCFTCGKVLADKYDMYVQRSQALEADVQRAEEKGEEHPAHHPHASFDRVRKDALLNEMGLTRYCCRRHMLGQVDMMNVI